MELETILEGTWRGLEAAPMAARSGWRLPVVSTVDAAGQPQARTMVLRGVEMETRRLRFFSDKRGLKMADLADNRAAQIVFYDEESHIQLRISGPVLIIGESRTIEIWGALPVAARYLYAANPTPGSQIDGPASGLPAEMFEDDEHATRIVEQHASNFAVFEVEIARIDWLQLTADGNRAARFEWAGEHPVQASWRIP
jgi:pyridoxamine 5'-phosphate oxidase